MKISNASKKVLASALSAAMVVAFAPTVAFGAQEGMKLKVNYDFAGGVESAAAGTQGLKTAEELVVDSSNEVTFQTVATGALQLNSGTKADGTPDGYEFASWNVWADTNKDGKIVKEGTDKDLEISGQGVSDAKIDSSTPLYATATYATAKLSSASVNIDQANGKLLFSADKTTEKCIGTAKFVVTSPSGAKTEKGALSSEKLAAEVGTWTVELVDGNGIVLDAQKYYVGNVVMTGGAYKNWDGSGKDVTTQTVWYLASAEQSAAKYVNSADNKREHTTATKINEDGSLSKITANGYYTAKGEWMSDITIKAGEKGAVSTAVTADYNDGAAEIKGLNFDKATGQIKAVISGNVSAWANAAALKDVAENTTDGYYFVVKNAKGEVVAETAKTGDKGTVISGAKTMTISASEAGVYTATLYKLTAKSSTVGDTTPGTMEAVSTATVEIADDYAAAPTWSYTAKYKADGTVDGGTLVLTNNAGDAYDVMYGTTSAASKYDAAKGGIAVAAGGATNYVFKAAIKDTKATEKKASKEVTLVGYSQALSDFKTAAGSFNLKTVNGKVGAYYVDNADVKAAVKAAEKTFTDKGFAEKTAQAADATKAWAPVTVAAEQSVVDAVAGVAKAELAKYAAGVASADGKKVTVLSAADYDAAVKAVEAVSAAYAANHDGDKGNNVAKVNDVALSTAIATYVDAVEADLKAGVKKAESFKAEDVAAAKAVTEQLKAAKTGDEAKAAIEAYGKLSNEAKKLIAAADIAAVQDVITKAELAEAQDEAAIAAVKGKTVKAKAKKATKSSLKVVTSKSGAKSTFKKTSGNSKVKVYKSGKIVVKKGLKAGKKYTVKVKATVGASTKTVKVIVKVAK